VFFQGVMKWTVFGAGKSALKHNYQRSIISLE
jgi:hypothetical protein